MRQIQFFSTMNDIYLFLGLSYKKELIFLSYDIDLIIRESLLQVLKIVHQSFS
jgi:hypothetical protein